MLWLWLWLCLLLMWFVWKTAEEKAEREESLHQGREQRKEERGAAGKWFYNYEGRVQVEWKLLVVLYVSSLKERRADPK